MTITETMLAVARGDAPADLVIKNARVLDVFSGKMMDTSLAVTHGRIAGLGDYDGNTVCDVGGAIVVPGFIDAHVHIESSMTSVSEFVRAILPRGTTAVVADPHEIANVLGTAGIDYMLTSANDQPMEVYFTLPSCVPATHMETVGSPLTADDLAPYFSHPRIVGLAEMMNFPGVMYGDPGVAAKLAAARTAGKPMDGHAPGLSGLPLNAYLFPGIGSDHECLTAAEALEKLSGGMHIMVREGTCARNLEAIAPAITADTWHRMMWCTDDRHPHDLLDEGHVDAVVRKAIRLGIDPVTAVRMATLVPATWFRLDHHGAIAPGRRADFLVLSDLETVEVAAVYAGGRCVAENGKLLSDVRLPKPPEPANTMNVKPGSIDFSMPAQAGEARVIRVTPSQVFTETLWMVPRTENGMILAEPDRDILKIAVLERHTGSGRVGKGLVNGMGIRNGALASSVGHDAHNIIVVGDSDAAMETAVRAVIDMGGGYAAVKGTAVAATVPLRIAGLMSTEPVETVRASLDAVLDVAASLGSPLPDPFMTLGFLALAVIPELKITDHGLVDVDAFQVVPLFRADAA
ncbi:MAG: adenine deaminase [Deltaproteobacteria bacterium]|nr:MAG: adenine deaminase [Deltaproteobacteria bacterium]